MIIWGKQVLITQELIDKESLARMKPSELFYMKFERN